MSLDSNALENVKKIGDKTTARCPACAEDGHDRTGEHLFISATGRFGCVVYPGREGAKHRKRIFELVGVKEPRTNTFTKTKTFTVRRPPSVCNPGEKVIQRDVLGHLGRVFSPYAGKGKE